MNRITDLGGSLALAFALTLSASPSRADAQGVIRATAQITGCTDPAITGTAQLTERPTEEGIKLIEVSIVVRGLTDGKHAVHVHEVASCTPCGAAGGHHDPGPAGNSAPDAPVFNHPFHMGDLVNLEVHGGVGVMHTTTSRFTLSEGRLSILDENGSAFIIHALEDTYCDAEGELTPGCAGGGRVACGIITRAN
jgi:Cu-Zn family superoxide dismutase